MSDDVASDLTKEQRVGKLVNFLNKMCQNHGAVLMARTFAWSSEGVSTLVKAFAEVDKSVMLMSKCVPHDWEVFYPHNPAVGRFSERTHVVEYDPGGEFYGKGKVPYLYPEYDEAVFLANAARQILDEARTKGLDETNYNTYKERLDKLVEWVEKWSAGHKKYIAKKSGGQAPAYEGDFPVGGPPRIDIRGGVKSIISETD